MGYREYESAMQREIEMWPGATIAFGHAAKHRVATVTFNGDSRKTFYPESPSCRNGHLNKINDLRKLLRGLGATRVQREKSEPDNPRHRPTPATPQRFAAAGIDTSTRSDHWHGRLQALRDRMAS